MTAILPSKEILIQEVLDSSLKAVCKKYHADGERIKRVVGVNSFYVFSKYKLFDKIDNEIAAYWLGYLYADGCVYKNKLCLSSKDIGHLYKYQEDMNAKTKICTRFLKGHTYGISYISCPILVHKLINLGCVPRKSLILQFPTDKQVPKYLLRHFVRGYFDGDGCVCYNKRQASISFCGTFGFLSKLSQYFVDIGMNERLPKFNKGECYQLHHSAKSDILKFYETVYKDSVVNLDRKNKIFIDIMQDNFLSRPGCSIDLCWNKPYRNGRCYKHHHERLSEVLYETETQE